MSKRLTKDDREEIVQAVFNNSEKAREIKALGVESKAKAQIVYNKMLGEHYHAVHKLLPVGFFAKTNTFYLYYQGERVQVVLHKEERMPDAWRWQTIIKIDEPNQWIEDYLAADLALGQAIGEKKALMQEIRAVVNQASTLKQLLKTWPEIEPYIPERLFEDKIHCLAPVMGLNDRLGLKAGEQ